MNTVTTSLIIVALVEVVKSKFPKVNGLITVLLAVVLGAVIGFFGLNGENLVSGITAGLVAVGGHQVASTAGGK